MSKKIIYVAGKYRDERGEWFVEQNIRKAEEIAILIWQRGAVAICPHLNTIHFGGICPDEVWLEGDLEIISRCDAIYMLRNWKESPGATAEHAFAKQQGIPILYGIGELDSWIFNNVFK